MSTSQRSTPSGSSTPTNQTLDAYRPLAAQVRKPILPFIPSASLPLSESTPPLQTILGISQTAYTSRLSNKNILLDAPYSSSAPTTSTSASGSGSNTISPLVVGKKRNRGNPVALATARREVEERDKGRAEKGVLGLRKVMKLRKEKGKGKEVVRKGMKISYETLLPLHHLHTLYLVNLLNLPPLPPLSSSSTSVLPTNLANTQPLPQGLSPESIQSKLVKADFTGINLSVKSSRNPSLVGKKGIVIEETSNTFRLVQVDSRVVVIPKDGTLFGLSFPGYAPPPRPLDSTPQIDDNIEVDGEGEEEEDEVDIATHLNTSPRIEMDLLGSAFLFRSGDRAGRKFRPSQGGGGGSGWGEEWVKSGLGGVLNLLDDSSRREAGNGSGGMVLGSERRKRDVGRRKDPLTGGSLQV